MSCLNNSAANLLTILQKATILSFLLNKIYYYRPDFKLFLVFRGQKYQFYEYKTVLQKTDQFNQTSQAA